VLNRPDAPVPPAEAAAFAALLRRRLAGEPVSRIAGRREFWSLSFRLGSDTLDPRPDSETVAEAALAVLPERGAPWRLLDLGTGTGCLLLALLSERPAAFGIGLDRSPGAAATARDNARALGLAGRSAFVVGDWTAAIAGAFDLIVSNPPYIESGAIAGLEPGVREHDPRAALDGGRDGLDAYRAIVRDAPRLLRPGGALALEIGEGQGPAISQLLDAAGLVIVLRRHDLSGIERCLVAKKTFA